MLNIYMNVSCFTAFEMLQKCYLFINLFLYFINVSALKILDIRVNWPFATLCRPNSIMSF